MGIFGSEICFLAKHIVESCLLIQPASLSLFIGEFRPFTLKVITEVCSQFQPFICCFLVDLLFSFLVLIAGTCCVGVLEMMNSFLSFLYSFFSLNNFIHFCTLMVKTIFFSPLHHVFLCIFFSAVC